MMVERSRGRDEPSPSGLRRYKACRICRRQKLGCDGQNPCWRCENAGASCIYDQNLGRRRNNRTPRDGSCPTQKQQIEALTAQIHRLESQVARSLSFQETQPLQPATLQAAKAKHSSRKTVNCEVLSPDDLEVPVTAVHVMIHPSPNTEPQRNESGWTTSNQSRWHREEYNFETVIEKAVIDEAQARSFFSDYVQHCNIATPILDPVLDTYESVSEFSPSTLTVTLYLAARQKLLDENPLWEEVKLLAGSTLFENPCSVDRVQAILLLAIHSEKTWFALGHALQMAFDLGLNWSMARVLSNPESCTRYDSQCARIWLFIVYFERAIALGTTRQPRCEAIQTASLELLVQCKYSHPSDIFFCASLELFDISAGLRKLEKLPTLDELEVILAKWSAKWDDHYDRHCIHPRSLQRVRFRVQNLFARTWQLAIFLVRPFRMNNESPQDEVQTQVIDLIIETVHELFRYICESDVYKRYFPWSPTYEALLLTFTVIIGHKVLSMYPNMQKLSCFKKAAEPIAELLRNHPCQRFSTTVDGLLYPLSSSAQCVEIANSNTSDFDWFNNDWNFDIQDFGDWLRDAEDHMER